MMRKTIITALLTAMLVCTAQASPPTAFTANYELYRNGKLFGEATLTLGWAEGRWTLHNQSKGTKGLARILGFTENTISNGAWSDQGARPIHYEQKVKAAGKRFEWQAEFDWSAPQVTTRHDEGESALPLVAGTVDPLSAGLVIRAGLAQGEQHWQLRLVDEDEIDEHEYRQVAQQATATGIGCVETVQVDRIRDASSSRYTRTYYAPRFGYVPVKVEHGKTGGDHMETRLAALRVDGQPVNPEPACE